MTAHISQPYVPTSTARRWPWVAAVIVAMSFVWPLQALAIAMLAATGLMISSIYAALRQHDVMPTRVRAAMYQPFPIALGGALMAGVVLAAIWPSQVTPIAFGVLVVACGAWVLAEWLLGWHEHRRARSV